MGHLSEFWSLRFYHASPHFLSGPHKIQTLIIEFEKQVSNLLDTAMQRAHSYYMCTCVIAFILFSHKYYYVFAFFPVSKTDCMKMTLFCFSSCYKHIPKKWCSLQTILIILKNYILPIYKHFPRGFLFKIVLLEISG